MVEEKLEIFSKSQSFTSHGSHGTFNYYTTTANYNLDEPLPVSTPLKPGDLFIHINSTRQPQTRQVWLYNKYKKWEDISEIWENSELLVHPEIAERVLTVRANQTPNWVLRATVETAGRKNKNRSVSVGV